MWFIKTYVFHESTVAIPSISILLMPCSRRTMMRFHYVVPSKRSCGSSTGQGGRANAEPPFAAGHLQDTIGHGDEVWRKVTNVSSCLFHLTFGEEQLQTQSAWLTPVSTRHIPKSCRILSIDAFPSNGTIAQRNSYKLSDKHYAPSITTLIRLTRP